MMRTATKARVTAALCRWALVVVLACALPLARAGGVVYAQSSPPVEVKPLPTPEEVTIPPEVLRQIDADLASAGGVEEQDLPNPINWIIRKIITVTVQIPWQHVTNALSRIFGAAVGRDMGMFKSNQNRLHDLAVEVAWGLLRREELGAIGGRIAAATLGVAVPFYLLRLLIYHWRRLMGEPDDLLAVVGDWLTAGALAAVAPNIVVLALDTGILISERAFGGRLPDLVGSWVNAMLDPFSNLVGLVSVASEIGFMSVLGLFLIGFLTVAAVAAIIFIIAAVMAVSYLLVALGPIACVLSVVPQMRWARSMWLKAVLLVGITPVAIGVVHFAFFQVFMPPNVQSYAGYGATPPLEAINPFAFLTRLVWLVGATGFLLSVVGSVARVGLGSAVVAINMARKAATAVVGLAGAAVTGGAALAVGAGALASVGGVSGLMGATGTTTTGGGTMATLRSLGGLVGGGVSPRGGTGSDGEGTPPTTVGTPSPASTGTAPTDADRVGRMMQRATTARRAAMALGLLGRRTISSVFHLAAMNLERQAWGEEIRRRIEEDPAVHAPRVAEEMGQALQQPVNDVTAKGVLSGVRQEGGSVSRAMEGFHRLLQDWRETGGTNRQLADLMRARPRDVGRIIAAYQRGLPGDSPRERLMYARNVLTLGGYTSRALTERMAWDIGGEGEGPASSPTSPPHGPQNAPPTGGANAGERPGTQRTEHRQRTEEATRQVDEDVTRRVRTEKRTRMREEREEGTTDVAPGPGGGSPTAPAGAQGSPSSPSPFLYRLVRGEVRPPGQEERTTVDTPNTGASSPGTPDVAPTPPADTEAQRAGEGQGGVRLGVKINDDMRAAYQRLPAPGQRFVADFAHHAPTVQGSPSRTQMVIAHAAHLRDAFPERTDILFEEYARARRDFPGNDAENVALAWEQTKEAYGRRVYGDNWQERVKQDPIILSLDGYMS